MSFLRGQDAWRRHPIFTWGVWQALPGIREGSAAFALYYAYDFAMSRRAAAAHAPAHPAPGAAEVVSQGSLEGSHGSSKAAHH